MAMSDQRLQFLLAQEEVFVSRVEMAMITVALEVLAEADDVPDHQRRVNYATTVLNSPTVQARTSSPTLAQSTNVRGTITMEDEGPRTSVTDAALASQVSGLWNALAGIEAPAA